MLFYNLDNFRERKSKLEFSFFSPSLTGIAKSGLSARFAKFVDMLLHTFVRKFIYEFRINLVKDLSLSSMLSFGHSISLFAFC